jgi:hypothetical protein
MSMMYYTFLFIYCKPLISALEAFLPLGVGQDC